MKQGDARGHQSALDLRAQQLLSSEYWARELGDDVQNTPLPGRSNAQHGAARARSGRILDPRLGAELVRMCNGSDFLATVIGLTALSIVIQRITCRDEVWLGAADLAPGFGSTAVFVRAAPRGEATFKQLCAAVQARLCEGHAHAMVDWQRFFGERRAGSEQERRLRHFGVCRTSSDPSVRASFDVSALVDSHWESVALEYPREGYRGADMERVLGLWVAVLSAVAASPYDALGHLQIRTTPSPSDRPVARGRGEAASPLIFVHVPRSGGTTLASVIERQYGRGRTFRIDVRDAQGDTSAAWRAFEALEPQARERIRALHGHQSYGSHRRYFDDATYVTLLRDPVDRIVSYYYFILNDPTHYLHGPLVTRRMKLRDFVQCGITSELDNGQTRQICGRSGVRVGGCSADMLEEAKERLQREFRVFGLTERFDESVVLMRRALGWAPPHYSKLNTGSGRQSRRDVTDEIVDLIGQTNPYDVALYEFAARKFEQVIAAQGAGFRAELRAMQAANSVIRLGERAFDRWRMA